VTFVEDKEKEKKNGQAPAEWVWWHRRWRRDV